MSPEVLDGNYTEKADTWSIGVVLYTLVSCYLPFQGAGATDVFEKIKSVKFHFDHEEFKMVSDECKDLISKLLVVGESNRLSAQEALNHPWFKVQENGVGAAKVNGGDRKISDDLLPRLRSFKGVSTFKQAAMNLLVKTASEAEVKQLRAAFEAIDKDGNGMI